MSDVSAFLSAYYNDGQSQQAESSEDLHKQAQIELFQKLASSQGIDLESLSDEQVQSLWGEFQSLQSKTASEEEKKDDKKEEAKKELEEKKAMAEKVAEADSLGRIMAHAYVDELQKIAKKDKMVHIPGQGSSADYSSRHPGAGNKGNAVGESMGRMKLRHALERGKDKAKEIAGKASGAAGSAAGKAGKFLKGNKGAVGAALGAAAVGAGAGAAAMRKKESSAVDEYAAELAIEKAAADGWNADEAAELVAEVLLNGASESTKIAGVADVDQALDIRAFELLEQAGYPVTWQ